MRFGQQGATREADETTPQVNGVGTVTSVAGTRQIALAPGPNVTRFTTVFRPGDLFEAPQGGAQRVVVTVDSDTVLTVSTPFPGGLAGVTFRRAALDRRQPRIPPAPLWQVQAAANDAFQLTGVPAANAVFGAFFRAGDTIRVKPGGGLPNQERLVVEVLSDTTILISQPLGPTPAVAAPYSFEWVGQEPGYLFNFLASTDDTLSSGESVMNHAADLAALLSLAATSQVLPETALAKGPMQTATICSASIRCSATGISIAAGKTNGRCSCSAAPSAKSAATPPRSTRHCLRCRPTGRCGRLTAKQPRTRLDG